MALAAFDCGCDRIAAELAVVEAEPGDRQVECAGTLHGDKGDAGVLKSGAEEFLP